MRLSLKNNINHNNGDAGVSPSGTAQPKHVDTGAVMKPFGCQPPTPDFAQIHPHAPRAVCRLFQLVVQRDEQQRAESERQSSKQETFSCNMLVRAGESTTLL